MSLSPRQFSTMARHRLRFRRATSEHLCQQAQDLIDASRRLIAISGGSANDPSKEKIWAALRAGLLPRIDLRAWAGKADGTHRCACCALPIRPDEVEYEPQSAPGLYAHVECFSAWRAGSDLVEHDRRREPGTAAAGG